MNFKDNSIIEVYNLDLVNAKYCLNIGLPGIEADSSAGG